MVIAAIESPKPQVRPATEDTTVIRIIPELAAKIGLNESVMLLQIAFWIGSANTGRFIDGSWWTWQSIRDMHDKVFSYWSIATINRTIGKLVGDGYVIEGNYNERKYDRTRWLTLNLDNLAGLPGITVLLNSICPAQNETQSSQIETHSAQDETRSTQNETTIPEKSSEITTEISSETKNTTALVPVAQPEQAALEAVASSSVYVIPVLTEVDLFEMAVHGESGKEANQPPEARAIVLPSKQKTAVRKVSSTPPRIPPKPLPALTESDLKYGRVVGYFESGIGNFIPPRDQPAAQKDVDAFPEDWLMDAIDIAVRKKKLFWGYVSGILMRWKLQGYKDTGEPAKPVALPAKKQDDFDPYHSDDEPHIPLPEPEPVDLDWQTLGTRVKTQGLSVELHSTFKQCKFGGVKDGMLTVICPTDPVFKACYRTLRHNRWLFWQAESLWGGITDVDFILEGDTDAVPEVP